MTTFVIKLNITNAKVKDKQGNVITDNTKKDKALADGGVPDWIPALIAAATEIEQLNAFVGNVGYNEWTKEDKFPRPIKFNKTAMVYDDVTGTYSGEVEKFLGDVNTPPTIDGFITVRLSDYEWLELGSLPAQPTTFSFVAGIPTHAGTII